MNFDEAALDVYREIMGEEWQTFTLDLIESFLQSGPNILHDLREAWETGDRELFTRMAHTLKSNSKVFGAQDVSALALELETMGEAGALDHAAGPLGRLEGAFEDLTSSLDAYRHTLLAS